MGRRTMTRRGGRPMWALLRHEFRTLARNRAACAVLILFVATAVAVRFHRDTASLPSRETCYIVYWLEDDWVRLLRDSLPAYVDDVPLDVEIVPVTRLTGHDNVIRHSSGCHSIQLRPLPANPDGKPQWLVWYWYDGQDPSVLWPYTRWFWEKTREHFGGDIGWHEQCSSLEPLLTLPGVEGIHLSPRRLLESMPPETALLWMVLYFTAFQLPGLSLAEAWTGRSIYSLAMTTLGWRGIAIGKCAFYLVLATMMIMIVLAMLAPRIALDPAAWLAIGGSVLAYLGLAFVVASWCRSVSAVSAAGVLYLILVAGVYCLFRLGAFSSLGATVAQWLVPEARLFGALGRAHEVASTGSSAGANITLLAWACLWQVAGWFSFRRRAFH